MESNVHRRGLPDAREKRPVGALRRLSPYLRRYRLRFVVALAVAMGTVAAQVTQPQVIKRFIDEVLVQGRRERLVPYALVALALGFFGAAFAFIRRNVAGSISLGLEYDLRNKVYAHLQKLAVSFHDEWQSGQLVSRSVTDIAAIRRFLGFGVMWLAILAALFASILYQLVHLDAPLAGVVMLFCLPVVFISNRFARLYHEISRTSQDQIGDLTTIVEETGTGVRIVKAFGRMPERSKLFRAQADRIYATNMRGVHARSVLWSADVFLLGLCSVTVMILGGLRVIHGGLSLGGLVAFCTYQLMLVWPVRDLGWIIAMGEEATSAAERVFELLDTQPSIDDRPGALPLATSDGRIRFNDVSFRYESTEPLILDGFDLEIAAGETLAIVGMTGCGKSTVAALVYRAYDPTAGEVSLDGMDLRDLTVASLRAQVGVAFEDPILFSASVRENVAMGDPDATDEHVWDALRIAEADGFVRELPWALDTRVGEQGYSLSGGQRQRIALARAVIGRPRVLILDNPLSSVDVHTEAAIEHALREVLVGSTVVLIAHRPSTLLLADRVALMSEGKVIATGSHHDLLRDEPFYREVLAADVEGEREGVSA